MTEAVGCYKNVFQLFVDNGERTPFDVRRMTWHPTTYFRVVKVVIPRGGAVSRYRNYGDDKIFGHAWGYLYLRGEAPKNLDTWDKLGCAGCYQWVLYRPSVVQVPSSPVPVGGP